MSTPPRITERRDEILRVAARHGAGNVRLFGSLARGDDTPGSDVDLLVDVTGETTPSFREAWSLTSSSSWDGAYRW